MKTLEEFHEEVETLISKKDIRGLDFLNGYGKVVRDTSNSKRCISSRIVISNSVYSVFAAPIRYEGKTYEDDIYDVFVSIDNLNGGELSGVISPSFGRIISLEEIDNINKDIDIVSKLIKKYNLKPDDYVWLSDKGNVFAGNKKVKPVKVLKMLGIDEYRLPDIIETLEVMSIDFGKGLSIGSVKDVYTDPRLKIGSCMTPKGSHFDPRKFDVYTELGVQCIYYKNKRGILARTLLWENKYYDRIYSTGNVLSEEFQKYLESIGYQKLPYDYKSEVVSNTEYLPYLDTTMVEEVEGGIRFVSR